LATKSTKDTKEKNFCLEVSHAVPLPVYPASQGCPASEYRGTPEQSIGSPNEGKESRRYIDFVIFVPFVAN
jgi:hypothetical protein